MRRALASAFVIVALLFAAAVPPAHAALERMGPVTPSIGGYPAWYQDTTGLALEFCTPITQSELDGGWCVILPADVPSGAPPEVPFSNYSGEHFYYIASAGARNTGAILVLAVEGAFNTADPVAGEQIVFGRLRITMPSLPLGGTYKIYTPYGDFTFPGLRAGDRLFFTSDVGIACGTDFSCVLNSAIGPFLLPSTTPGGAELPPIPDLAPGQDPFTDAAPPTLYPGTGKKYIADPARLGPVTGSPLPPFTSAVDGLVYNHNRFRIEVNGTLLDDMTNFSLGGRVMAAAIPGKVTVNRATYSASATAGNKLDVFATAFPSLTGRLPGGALVTPVTPDIGYYDAPCTIDPVTGALSAPVGPAGTTLLYFQMASYGSIWWGQNLPLVIPTQVCVQDRTAKDVAGNVVPSYHMGDVTDNVYVTAADWQPTNGGTLTVNATSSDTVSAPTLTLSGITAPDPVTGQPTQTAVVVVGGTAVVNPVLAPPPAVTVTSTKGGLTALATTTGLGAAASKTIPVANADSATTAEGTPVTINELANDTLFKSPIDPATATVTITAPPVALGTAVINADKTITYTPKATTNGPITDIIGYTVTVNGVASNEAYISVGITAVNQAPVANPDAITAVANAVNSVNVLANDTDPDGATDLAKAVIVTWPATGLGPQPVPTSGFVTFTPTASGSFTYQAQDKAGVLSNTVTVTVTVAAAETILVAKSQYTANKNRWVVSGTDNISLGQTMTITLDNGTAAGTQVGTATVTAGAWALDTTTGPDPRATGATRIRITSSLGAFVLANITLK